MDNKVDDTTHSEDVGQQYTGQDDGIRGTARIHASRMEEALLREKPRPLRKSFSKLYACIFVPYLCSATNGFDANTFGKHPLPLAEQSFSEHAAATISPKLKDSGISLEGCPNIKAITAQLK